MAEDNNQASNQAQQDPATPAEPTKAYNDDEVNPIEQICEGNPKTWVPKRNHQGNSKKLWIVCTPIFS
jgi:hypothetical protein